MLNSTTFSQSRTTKTLRGYISSGETYGVRRRLHCAVSTSGEGDSHPLSELQHGAAIGEVTRLDYLYPGEVYGGGIVSKETDLLE